MPVTNGVLTVVVLTLALVDNSVGLHSSQVDETL